MAECNTNPDGCYTCLSDRQLLALIAEYLCNIKAGGIPVGGVVSVSNFPAVYPVTGDVGRTWDLNFATDQVDVSGSSVSVSNFPGVQPVSGTVTALQGTIPWTVDGTVAATQSGVWTTGRTWDLSFVADQVDVSGSALSVTNFPASYPVTQGTSPWVVSLTSTTITGTVAVTQSGVWSVGRTWDLGFATDQVDASGSVVALDAATLLALETITVLQGTSPWVVSGTVTATPTGTQDVNVVSSITLTVAATDLDIRDLTFAADKVDVSGSSVSVSNFPATVAVTQSTSPWVTNDPGLPNTLGQSNMAGSTSVVIASDQSAVPISAASLPLPAGAATSANQTTEITSLQLIDDVVNVQNTALNRGVPIFGQFDDVSTATVTENNVASVRITSARALHVAIQNATLAVTQSGSWTVTADTELPVAVLLSDGMANPTAPSVGSHELLWSTDQTLWVRAKSLVGVHTTDAGVAAAAPPEFHLDLTLTGSSNSANFGTQGRRCLQFMAVTTAGNGSLVVEVTKDGNEWRAIEMVQMPNGTASTVVTVLTLSTTRQFIIAAIHGTLIRFRVTGVTGTATINGSMSHESPGVIRTLSENFAWGGTLLSPAQFPGDAKTNSSANPYFNALGFLFNGTSWDRMRGDITNGLDVDVTRSALPAGAATSALQTQPGVDIGDVTVNNTAGAAAVNIQDGGNSITVDGTVTTTPSGTQDVNIVSSITLTVAATDLDIRNLTFAADKVDASGSTVTATGSLGRTWDLNFATDQADVSGSSVSVSNFPATVAVTQSTSPWVVSLTSTTITGTVAATQSGAWTTGRTWDLSFVADQVDASGSSVSVSNFPASQVVTATDLDIRDLVFSTDKVDASGSSVSVSNFPATVAVTQSTSPWVTNDPGLPNALGQAAMAGSTSVVIASDQSSLPVTVGNFPVTQPVSGTVTANQGTSPWVTNDPGLPNALGQAVMAGSTSVTIASDQTAIPISGTITATPSGTQDVNVVSSITLTVQATDLDIRDLTFAADKVDASGSSVSVTNFPASFSVTQGTSPWVVSGTVTATPTGTQDVNVISSITLTVQATDLDIRNLVFATDKVDASGSNVSVSNFPASQVVTATDLDIRNLTFATDKVDVSGSAVSVTNFPASFSVTQGTSPWVTSLTSTTITGTVAVTGTFWQATQPVSAASLPLPAGAATSALQTQPGVDIGDVTVNNGAAGAAVNVQDGGNSLTVDGTVNVVIPALPTIVATQVSVGTTQVAVPTSNLASRQTVTFKALGANGDKIYIGLTGVTALTGFELDAGSSVDIDADSTVNFFAISASGTQKVSTIEIA